MIGQHIYMRCPVGYYQNGDSINPGSRTAAVSDGLFTSNETVNLIETRCGLDEIFAGRESVVGYGKSVLKIFFPKKKQMVSARIWRVNDRLTNDSRICTYTFSHVITGDDLQKLSSDLGALFDATRYESYQSCSDRVLAASNKRLTINPAFSQLQPDLSKPDFNLFRQCGFTQETFRKYIFGIFQAISSNTPFAVLMPKFVRDRWTEDHDPMEQLLYATYMLLPQFVRVNLSCVSHWGCDVFQRSVAGIHLFFVHPKAQENDPQKDSPDELQKLMNSNMPVLDVEDGSSVNIDCEQPNRYIDFLCDVMSEKSSPTSPKILDSYFKNLIGNLYWKSAPTLELCEMLYLIWYAEQHNSRENYRAAVMGSATALARYAPEHPELDTFYESAISVLKENAVENPPELDPYLLHLLRSPEQPLKCYDKLYSLLLIRVLMDENCSEDLPKYLCAELGKLQAQEQVQTFFDGLVYYKWTVDNISSLWLQLVLAVSQFCEENDYPQIERAAAKTKETMIAILKQNKAWDKMKPYAGFNAEKLSHQNLSVLGYREACDELFYLLFRTSGEIKDAVAAYVCEEDSRLITQGDPDWVAEFADSFTRNLEQYIQEGGAPGRNEMNQLIRLFCNKLYRNSDALLPLFDKICRKWPYDQYGNPCNDLELLNKIFAAGDGWSQNHAVKQLTVLAKITLEFSSASWFPQTLLELLAKKCSAENQDAVFDLFCTYMVDGAVASEKLRHLMELLQRRNMLLLFYVYAIEHSSRSKDVAHYIGKKTRAVRKELLECVRDWPLTAIQESGIQNVYEAWLQEELQGKEPVTEKWKLLEEETDMIESVAWCDRFIQGMVFSGTLKSFAYDILEECIPNQCSLLSSKDVTYLDQILSNRFVDLDKRSNKMKCVNIMKKVDKIIQRCQIAGQDSADYNELYHDLDKIISGNKWELEQTVIEKRLERALKCISAADNEYVAPVDDSRRIFVLQTLRIRTRGREFLLNDYIKLCDIQQDISPKDKTILYLQLLWCAKYIDCDDHSGYGKLVHNEAFECLKELAYDWSKEAFGSQEDPDTIDEELYHQIIHALSDQDKENLIKLLERSGVYEVGHKNHELRTNEAALGSREQISFSVRDIIIALPCFMVCLVLCIGFFKMAESLSRISQVLAVVIVWVLNGIMIAVALIIRRLTKTGDRRRL